MSRSQLNIRLSAEDRELIYKASKLVGMNVSDFARLILVRYSLGLTSYKPGKKQEVTNLITSTGVDLLNAVELRWMPLEERAEGEPDETEGT